MGAWSWLTGRLANPQAVEGAIAVIDLGATTFRVALIDDAGVALALVDAPSRGIDREGLLNEVEGAAEVIAGLIAQAEALSEERVARAMVCVPARLLSGFSGEGHVAIRSGEVELDDLFRAAEHAVFSREVNPGARLIHALPTGFNIDGQNGVIEPIGLAGYRLSTTFYWVFVNRRHGENFARLFQLADLPEPLLFAGPLAAAMGGLTRDEAELGAVSIDLGHTGCGISVWVEGSPAWVGHVPVGGRHLSGDLRQVFSISEEQAIKVLERGIPAVAEMAKVGETIGAGRRSIELHKASKVVQARLEDTFQRIRNLLNAQGFWWAAEHGVVLSGGLTCVPGLERLAEAALEVPVRVASMEAIERDWTWPPTHAEVVSFRHRPGMTSIAGALEFARLNLLDQEGVINRRPWPAPALRDLHEKFRRSETVG
jgi:cell division protein FtsA